MAMATMKLGKYAKEESFWSSFSRKACGEFEGRSPSITKGRNQNAMRTIRAKQTPDPKGAAIKELGARTNKRSRSNFVRIYCRARHRTATAFPMTRPSAVDAVAAEGRKLTKLCPKTKPSTSPANPRPKFKTAICYMDFKSASLLTNVLRYRVAPDGARNRIRFAVRFHARAIFTQIVCAGALVLHTLGNLVLPAHF